MNNVVLDNYRIISTNQLVRAIKEGKSNSERFCFILGSGASASSNIPTGGELERKWLMEMEEDSGFDDIREVAQLLRRGGYLDNDFEDIEKEWKKIKYTKALPSSKYYFDIYKLRFFPNHRNGYHYLEEIMASSNVRPSFGYHTLALMLTDENRDNLVITTNFDNLVEDALFLYTDSKPLVINHELLADFAGDPNIKRPIIAKIHRGIFFDPLNRPEETNELKGTWHDVLMYVFQCYTPIVIGYGGGDNSLMELLSEKSVSMKNGIYWCYVEEKGLPNEKIQKLVQEKKGYFVRTAGFDAIMLAIGNKLFPDKIGAYETEKYLSNRMNEQIINYGKEYKKLAESGKHNVLIGENGQRNQSEDEFKKEIEKITDRDNTLESKRQKLNQMTAWDYRRQGDRYFNLGNYNRAIEFYSQAICKQSNIAHFYNDRGICYKKMHEYGKALADYRKAIELDPEYAEAYNNRGCVYIDMGNYSRAIDDCNSAIKLNPEYAGAYNNRGCAYSNLGQYDKAIDDYNKAIEMNPNYAIAYRNRGCIYNELKMYDLAIVDFNRAIELNSNYAEAYFNRGYAYDKLYQNKKAMADYNRAIKLNAAFTEAYNSRSRIYQRLGEYEKALTDYNIAIELKPKEEVLYNNRGFVFEQIGEFDKAISDFNKAIILNPSFSNPYIHLGGIYKKKEDFEKSIFYFTKAIELNPKLKKAYEGRAKVFRLMGEVNKAILDEKNVAEL